MTMLYSFLRNTAIFLIIISIVPVFAASETGSLLQEGKQLYWSGDYKKAERVLKELINKDASVAEAYYFMGYTICRLESPHNAIPDYTWEKTDVVSKIMEKVVALQPNYSGEIIVLSPREKIMTEWSALALSYINKGEIDKAVQAFKEAQKRGGLIPELYDFMKNMLISCPDDAILVTAGDMDTFFPLYLQVVEGVRTDVTVLNIHLCQSPWFLSMLLKKQPWQKHSLNLPFSPDDRKEINTILVAHQKPFSLTILKPGFTHPDSSINLSITPVSYGKGKPEVLISDLVFLYSLKNSPQRPLCIASTVKYRQINFRVYHDGVYIDPFTQLEKRGLVDILTLNPQSLAGQITALETLLVDKFTYTHFPNSPAINRYEFYVNETIAVFILAASLMDKAGEQDRARQLCKKLLDRIPGIRFLENQEQRNYLLGLAGVTGQ